MRKKTENFEKIAERALRLEALIKMTHDVQEKEGRIPLSFNDFMHVAATEPERVFRNIFQLFHDMIKYYIPEGKDEYAKTKHTAGFKDYDTSNLFENNCNEPFFSDRLFANRLMSLVENFKKGSQNNHIFLFEGPPGSGKSTFLNILLSKLQHYTRKADGTIYKTYWRLDHSKIDTSKKIVTSKHFDPEFPDYVSEVSQTYETQQYTNISCPNNDHPITLIPLEIRRKFLDELIPDKAFKEKLFNSKEYEWVLNDTPCSICSSIYNELHSRISNPLDIFSMVYAKKVDFNRQFGKGVSIYNPGDDLNYKPITNNTLQTLLNELFKSDEIRYIYSNYAYTNNGIYALMDIKENNIHRLKNLHGIISDGVHKVEHVEERIKSMFVGLINPEDKKHYESIQSFRDRVITVKIPYVLDYNTESKIYINKFGSEVENAFMPRVLSNFAKIIVSTRLERESPIINNWLKSIDKYKKYVDKDLLLLKMELYTGKIPNWLSPEDVKGFTLQVRKDIIKASENEGQIGISGRQSINVFNSFLGRYKESSVEINMDNVLHFFKENEQINKLIPDGFCNSLNQLYEFNVLQEVKESIYYYNEKQISRDILNYLYAINYEIGDKVKSLYTGDTIEIDEDFFKNFEAFFTGTTSSIETRKAFRKDIHHEYITRTLAREISIDGKKPDETELFEKLFRLYSDNLKENSLSPFAENDNFRRGLVEYGTKSYAKMDDRIKKDINRLIINLVKKFGYTEQGALYVSLMVIDRKLHQKFSDFKPY